MRRPVRIANCSGAHIDPGEWMLHQATAGPIDVITGDYLAEANIASNALAHAAGTHPGWQPSALEGIRLSLPAIHARGIKVVINGGALNPRGLAVEVDRLARKHAEQAKDGKELAVAYVEGDNLLPRVHEFLVPDERGIMPHLDAGNESVEHAKTAHEEFLGCGKGERKKIIAANAYLGSRGIRAALEAGADIVICGRVADASPVIGAAAWWHSWPEPAPGADPGQGQAQRYFDRMAGALVAGHLIECSQYSTGGNFAGFDGYEVSELMDLACPIAEVDGEGGAVITKHEALNGVVTVDVVKCQLLYELQGDMYLNSDVKADLRGVELEQVGRNRVRLSGIKGLPPPPTTKLAVFYAAGYQGELTLNATGLNTDKKWDLAEAQLRHQLQAWNIMGDIDLLEFQRVGAPQENPRSQLAATTYMRIVVQAGQAKTVKLVMRAWLNGFMQHFPGMHGTLDWRLMKPLPFLGYYPATVAQSSINETATILNSNKTTSIPPPTTTAPLAPRNTYDTPNPVPLSTFGPTTRAPLGSIALARSGDKGANVNIGFTVSSLEEFRWLRTFLSRDRLKELMGKDWRDEFVVERVEFEKIYAVHFVVYGLLGRGVSSSARLDSLGKGVGEWLRAVWVDVPVKFLKLEKGVKGRVGKM